MTKIGIDYIVRQPDVNEGVVGEILDAVELVGAGEHASDISWRLEHRENVAAISLSQEVRAESVVEYLHRADVLASAVLERCSDDMYDRVQAAFAGVRPPGDALYQE